MMADRCDNAGRCTVGPEGTPPGMGVLRPATPLPDFDLDLTLGSLDRIDDRRPAGVALAHSGLVPDPVETVEEAKAALRRWVEVAGAAHREGRDIGAALEAVFSPLTPRMDDDRRPSWRPWAATTPTARASAGGWSGRRRGPGPAGGRGRNPALSTDRARRDEEA
jgi:hypothetical protein